MSWLRPPVDLGIAAVLNPSLLQSVGYLGGQNRPVQSLIWFYAQRCECIALTRSKSGIPARLGQPRMADLLDGIRKCLWRRAYGWYE